MRYVVSLIVVASLACLSACDPMDDVRTSHIDANVAAKSEFDSMVKRDAAKDLTMRLGRTVTVEYTLLREFPTQVGVAYPKYYAWLVARDPSSGQPITEGAARLAAIDRNEFHLTDFLNKAEIAAEPTRIEAVFPKQVCDEIRKRL